MMTLPTWDELYAWAQKKPNDATLGFSRNAMMGPVNLYFAEVRTHAQNMYWLLGPMQCGVFDWDTHSYRNFIDTPLWLHDLINICADLADEGHAYIDFHRPITAKMFKPALEAVRTEVT